MKNFIYRINSRLSMKITHCLFIDNVNGCEVFEYKDCFGNSWMAQNKYGFRTLRNENN